MRSEQEVAAMSCPVCRVPLAMSDRQGIEIDYCPQCRGVWLDRGELDKIIERSAPPPVQPQTASHQPTPAQSPQQMPQQGSWAGQQGGYDPGRDQGYRAPYRDKGHYGKPYKKRKSWLEDLFD
jgi:hypothetical protein